VVDSQVQRVGWYRFRATFRRRWTGYLSVALLVGLLGGIALASIAGARRTQSSYPKLPTATHASDLEMTSFGGISGPTADSALFTLSGTSVRSFPGAIKPSRWIS